MRILNHKHWLDATGLFLPASIAGLWSWNTLSELFDFPSAQYRHALAGYLVILLVKWGISPRHRLANRIAGGNHERPNR